MQPSVVDVAPDLVNTCPVGHTWSWQDVFIPSPEYLPKMQMAQPSLFDVALGLVDYWPAEQVCGVQEDLTPDESEYYPTPQLVQPSKAEDALGLIDFWPAGQNWSWQLSFWSVPDHLPIPQSTQPSDALVAFVLVEDLPASQTCTSQLVFIPVKD